MKPLIVATRELPGPSVSTLSPEFEVRVLHDTPASRERGLDVYENEPGITPALLAEDRVVLMPHAGSATLETRREMARMVVEDVRRVLTGEKPLRAVAPEGAARERLRGEP